MTTAAPAAPPLFLEALLERFDGDRFHAPSGSARVRLAVTGEGEWDALIKGNTARLVPADGEAEALLTADRRTWDRIARDVRGGMTAFRQGRLGVRHNLHLGVGLLAATSSSNEPGRLRFAAVKTPIGEISYAEAGVGPPLLALHGLGGTKASFLPTLAALSDAYRVIALDLPGFGESVKPIAAPYNAPWFARSMVAAMDGLEIERAHLVGNSMGGRVALEMGLIEPDRVDRMMLASPALAWLKRPPWAGALRFVRPELGLVQVAPRPVVERIVRSLLPGADDGWAAAGVDEFLRSFLTPRGRAAFYASARNILLDEPGGENGFWARLSTVACDCLFIWGRHDTVVPVAFRRHVEKSLPSARHVVLDCGHVPQVEAPHRTHHAMLQFLDSARD